MSRHFRLYLDSNHPTAPLIALIRRHTGKPISEIRQAIANRQPFLDETPHQNQYKAFIDRVTELVNNLEAEGIHYRVEINGLAETPEYLQNVFKRQRDISEEVLRMTDLELGEPCIETLEWLKREAPTDVLHDTLRQIVNGDGYTCDEETKAWARSELGTGE